MLSNPGHHTNQKFPNVQRAVTVSDVATAIVTGNGNVYHAGLTSGKVKPCLEEISTNANVGPIVDAEETDSKLYLLSAAGSVYEYEIKTCGREGYATEVYSPKTCGGDKAIQIAGGRDHILIRTENNKVFGAGNNEQYQLVPQGDCRYNIAVPILITDTVVHDNKSCDAFSGVYNEMLCPKLPETLNTCGKACFKEDLCDTFIGYINIFGASVAPVNQTGTLAVPLFADISYTADLCVDAKGCASGTVNWVITRLYIKCGAFQSKFHWTSEAGCNTRTFNTSSTTEILLYAGRGYCGSSDYCSVNEPPLSGSSFVVGKCGQCVLANINIGTAVSLPTVSFDLDCATIVLAYNGCRTSIAALCDTTFIGLEGAAVEYRLDLSVLLTCSAPCPKEQPQLPQNCWVAVYAGGDISVLVDSCNRLYALGSLHEVRSNKHLLNRSGMSDLLQGTHTTISFPADQINCSNKCETNGCVCDACRARREPRFKTDMGKVGISISFPSGADECREKKMDACEFLQRFQKVNEASFCDSTCDPCDGYVHLNIDCGCGPSKQDVTIGSLTIINRQSVTKLVSVGKSDYTCVQADINTVVDFDLNKYCIDAHDFPLDKVIKLNFCSQSGKDVIIYVDIDEPGGIKFESGSSDYNTEFTLSASTDSHQFILNYGSVMGAQELVNLKHALCLDCYFPSPQYRNPIKSKITNTYLRGGDHVRFVSANPKNIRQAVTADLPTMFRLNKEILDVAVGTNNLTVLVGGRKDCKNNIYAIGSNCHGELGLGNCESVVCWKEVDKCLFNGAQVISVFAGARVTFYITQHNFVFAAGKWKDLVRCTLPEAVKSICNTWRINYIAISATHIVFLSSNGCSYGVGDNTVGQLGLGSEQYVACPVPLVLGGFRNQFCPPQPPCAPCAPACGPAPGCFNGPRQCGPGFNPNNRIRNRY